MKNKKTKPMYSIGGDILGGISALSPLLSLIPGGAIAAPIVGQLAGAGAGMFNKAEQDKKMKENELMMNPSRYNNPSAFGYASGGQITNDSFEVTNGQGQIDGNSMDYKGKDIRLDYGETVDMAKDRIMSNRIINPRTDNTFAEDDKKLKTMRDKSDTLFNKTNDLVSKASVDFTKKMEDSLFNEQELNKLLKETKDNEKKFGKTNTQSQGFANGGPIDPRAWMQFAQGFQNGPNNYNYGQSAVQPISSSPYDIHNPGYQSPLPSQLYSDTTPDVYNPVNSKLVQDRMNNNQISPLPILQRSPLTSNTLQPNVSPLVNSAIASDFRSRQAAGQGNGNGFLNNLTLGEKIGMGTGIASVGLKAIEAFQKPRMQSAYFNNAPINKQQLDPTMALRTNDDSYLTALNDANNQTSSFNQRQSYGQSLFANKLGANNQIMTDYVNRNIGLSQQYDEQLGNRNRENNAAQLQADSTNSANRSAAARMRMGVYGDIATLGSNIANVENNKYTQDKTLAILKQLNPDVYKNVIDRMSEDLNKTKNKKDDNKG